MENTYFGARVHENGSCSFNVFAPHIQQLELTIQMGVEKTYLMESTALGVHELTLENVDHGMHYSLGLGGKSGIPDPASLWQPSGIKDGSVVLDHHFFDWHGDDFSGIPTSEMVIYEVHVGAFSEDSSFSGVISRLDYLCELGINTIQLLPVAQFSGDMGLGYDTVYPFAIHNSYGSPDDFKKLVRACHSRNIAVLVDVVFGSLTPVNELTALYEPFLSDKYKLMNGCALNYDGRFSCGVREFYIQCALSWLRDYHVDGLRISDADTVFDQTPFHFFEELSERVGKFADLNNRHCVLITFDSRNDPRNVLSVEKGGYNLDAMVCTDFNRVLQSQLTGDSSGTLADYDDPRRVVSAMQYGFAYRGELSPYYMRTQGRSGVELRGCTLVVSAMGHGQQACTGCGRRIIDKGGFEAAKLAAGATLLSPYVPSIFMGEEYGEPAPFQCFNNAQQVDNAAFSSCCLDWNRVETGEGEFIRALYGRLLKLRKKHPTIHEPCRSRCEVHELAPGFVLVFRSNTSGDLNYAAILMNFAKEEGSCRPMDYLPEGVWTTEIYSASPAYGGSGAPLPQIIAAGESITIAPHSFALLFYTRVRV